MSDALIGAVASIIVMLGGPLLAGWLKRAQTRSTIDTARDTSLTAQVTALWAENRQLRADLDKEEAARAAAEVECRARIAALEAARIDLLAVQARLVAHIGGLGTLLRDWQDTPRVVDPPKI